MLARGFRAIAADIGRRAQSVNTDVKQKGAGETIPRTLRAFASAVSLSRRLHAGPLSGVLFSADSA
jgi:hypothetical protein